MNRILLLIARVARTWTLPISMSIGAGVYLLFYYTPALEGLSQWFAPIFEAIYHFLCSLFYMLLSAK